jgi:hypothetical protein
VATASAGLAAFIAALDTVIGDRGPFTYACGRFPASDLALGFTERDAGVVFIADDLAAWLVGVLADAGRKRLTTWAVGGDQERALRQAATAAVRLTVGELCPEDGARAEELAMVIGQVFRAPVPEALLAGGVTILEAVQARIAGQLAVLDDAGLTGTGESSAQLLGLSGAVLAEKLTSHLVREIVVRGARGGPLDPLAAQLNHDATHLQVRRIENSLGHLAGDVMDALVRLDSIYAVAATPVPADVRKFDELLAEPMVGREWLAAEIDAFCDEHHCGYFLIEGDAGMGKTTFATWLAQQRNCAAHFAQRDPDAGTTAVAVRVIGAKLIADWDLTDLGREAASAAWLRSVFQAAARRRNEMAPGTPIIVVVDALDADVEPPDLHMPLGLPDRLPGGVFVVATARTGSLRYVPEGCTRRGLDGALVENIADLRQYLARAVNEPYLAAAIAQAGISQAQFADMLLERSAGIWIYVRYVLEEIRRDPQNVTVIPDLPRGLEDYYNNNLARLCTSIDGTGLYIPLLASLAVTAEPVNATVLAAFAGIGDWLRAELTLDGALRPYCQVTRLPGETRRRFKIRHPSLTEYLTGIVQAKDAAETDAGDRPANVSSLRAVLAGACRDGHHRICDRYLSAWGWLDRQLPDLEAAPELGEMDGGYALRWLTTHLLAADRKADLHRLLACGPQERNSWFTAHDSVGDVAGYLRDVSHARTVAEKLGTQLRYALVEASVASLSTALPPALIGELVTRNLWTVSRAFSHIERMTDESRQAQALARIAYRLPEPLLGPAMSVAMRCRHDENRVIALQAVIPRLSGDPLSRALEALLSIEHSADVLLAPIVAVASKLPKEMLRMFWREAWNFNWRGYRRAAVTFFSSEELPQGTRDALAAAREIENDYVRGLLVAALIPYFPPDAFDEVLTVLGELSRSRYIHPALIALARHCHEERLGDLLYFAVGKSPSPEFFQEAAPRLTAEQLPAALRLCQAEENERDRVRVFTALAPYLDTDQARKFLALRTPLPMRGMPVSRSTMSKFVIGEFLQIYDMRHELPVVGMLLERLPQREASAMLAELTSSRHLGHDILRMRDLFPPQEWLEFKCPEVFARYGKYSQGELRASSIIDICQDIRKFTHYPEEKALLLAQFAPFSQDEVTEIFDIMETAWWPEASVLVADVLAPYLRDDRLLLEIASRVRTFPLENECFAALAGLGRVRTRGQGSKIAQRTLALAAGVSDYRRRARAVAALEPILVHPELATMAFEIARSIAPSSYHMALAMDAIAPALPAELLQAIPDVVTADPAMDLAVNMPKTLERLSAEGYTTTIDSFLPRLPGPHDSWPFHPGTQLSRLAPYLSASQAQRLWLARELEILDNYEAEAWSALVCRLPQPERAAAVDEVLAACSPISARDDSKACVLGRLARAASTERLAQALYEFLAGPVSVWAPAVLEELAPCLPETLIEDALQYAVSAADDDIASKALAALAPRLSGALLNRAIAHVREMQHEEWKAIALTALARQLPHDVADRETVLAMAVEVAILWPFRSQLEGVMANLIPQLPEAMRPRAVEAAIKELISDLRYHQHPGGKEFDRLRAVLSILRGPELEQVYSRLTEVRLPRVRARAQAAVIRQAAWEHAAGFFTEGRPLHSDWPGDFDRAGLMDLLAAAGWWIARKSDGRDVDEVVEAIFDVTRWWP